MKSKGTLRGISNVTESGVSRRWRGGRARLREVKFSFACQKRTRKAPATFEAREARIKGCSPLTIPKKKSKPKNASRFAKTGCGSQRLLRCRSHPAGRGPNSSSLFPPLAAVVAVAPSRGASGEEIKLCGLPKPPLGRGGGTASAVTERLSPELSRLRRD